MDTKVIHVFFCSLGIFTSGCYGDSTEKKNSIYSPVEYLKNYALSSCVADGYRTREVMSDAVAAANGYKELGSLGIDAYNEAAILGRNFLAKNYVGQSGEKLVLMKCIDFYHSKELDNLARKYATKKGT